MLRSHTAPLIAITCLLSLCAIPGRSAAASAGNQIVKLHHPSSVAVDGKVTFSGQVVTSTDQPLANAVVFVAITEASTHCAPATCINDASQLSTDSQGDFTYSDQQIGLDRAFDIYPPDDSGFAPDVAGAVAFSVHTHNVYSWQGHRSVKVPDLMPTSLALSGPRTRINSTAGAPTPRAQVSRDGGKHWVTVSTATGSFFADPNPYAARRYPEIGASKPGRYLLRVIDSGAALQDAARSPVEHITVTKRKIPTWLKYTNRTRHSVGLQTVFEKKSFDTADNKHVHWMTRNNEICHCEPKGTPGYTKQGNKAGENSVLELGGASSDKRAVDIWLGAPFHTTCLLRSTWSVGGFARYDDAAAEWCLPGQQVFDIATSNGGIQPDLGKPLSFPSKHLAVPADTISNLGESPDPTQSCPGHWNGWSVPLLFRVSPPPASDPKLKHTSIRLTHGHHRIGPVCVISATTFHSKDSYDKYVVNSILAEGPWVIGLVKQRLSRGATYKATLSDGKYRQSTSFTIANH